MHFYIMSFYLLLGYFSIFPHFFSVQLQLFLSVMTLQDNTNYANMKTNNKT